MNYLPPVTPEMVPKLKNAQDLLKFGTCDISNIPISISMPPVRSKLAPK